MKKTLLWIPVLFLWGCSSTKVEWHSGTFEQVLDKARQMNKPILVDFYSPT